MAVLFASGLEAGALTYYRRAGWTLDSASHSILTTSGFVHKMSSFGGSYSLRVNAGSAVTPVFSGTARWLHFWFRTVDTVPPTTATFSITCMAPDNVNQMTVTFRTDGFVELRRGGSGGTLVATSASSVSYASGHWIEVELLAQDAAGTMNVYVDGSGSAIVSFSGDTKSSVDAANWQAVSFNGNEDVHYDDIFVTDSTTGRLGEQTGVRFAPNSDVSAGWTPSTGSNFQNVDDVPAADTPANNNEAAVTATEDIYGLTLPVSASSIAFVAANGQARRQGSLKVQVGIRSGATTSYATAAAPGTGPDADALQVLASHILTQNPDTVAAWVAADLPGLQAAIKTS